MTRPKPWAPSGLVHFVPIRLNLSIDAMLWCVEHVEGRFVFAGELDHEGVELGIWAFDDENTAFTFKMRFG